MNTQFFVKEFVPYQPSFDMKKLGFDEPCFGYYLDEKLNIFHSTSENDRINSKTIEIFSSEVITSPTFSQAFRWFREKSNIYANIDYDWNDEVFRVKIMKQNEDKSCNVIYLKEGEYIKDYRFYEKAELECLKKLIEIAKENK